MSPLELHADVGDEIRWRNLLSRPVRLGFLGVKRMEDVGCDKGFTTWFGEIRDLVTIPPGDYVSLCFRRTGVVRYNVWTDLADLVRSMSPTAVLRIDE